MAPNPDSHRLELVDVPSPNAERQSSLAAAAARTRPRSALPRGWRLTRFLPWNYRLGRLIDPETFPDLDPEFAEAVAALRRTLKVRWTICTVLFVTQLVVTGLALSAMVDMSQSRILSPDAEFAFGLLTTLGFCELVWMGAVSAACYCILPGSYLFFSFGVLGIEALGTAANALYVAGYHMNRSSCSEDGMSESCRTAMIKAVVAGAIRAAISVPICLAILAIYVRIRREQHYPNLGRRQTTIMALAPLFNEHETR